MFTFSRHAITFNIFLVSYKLIKFLSWFILWCFDDVVGKKKYHVCNLVLTKKSPIVYIKKNSSGSAISICADILWNELVALGEG